MRILLLTAGLVLSGCASINGYYSGASPTLSSIARAGGAQIYQSSLFIPSDFTPRGKARAFADYNFITDSAPCAIAPGYAPPHLAKDQFLVLTAEGLGELAFTCRGPGAPFSAEKRRLYLVGSAAECRARTWDYTNSYDPFYRKLAELCRPGGRDYGAIKRNYDRTAALGWFNN